MKKIILMLAICSFTSIAFAQSKIAVYSSGSFTIYLTGSERSEVWDSIASVFGYSGSTFDSAVINDQDPPTVDSAAYVIFYGDYHGTKITFGFYLTKANNHGDIEYFIDDDNTSVERAWSCKPPEEDCSSQACKPERNWFLGPVKSCSCTSNSSVNCELTNSGIGWLAGILIVIGIIAGLL